MAFSITPDVPMERKNGCLAPLLLLPTMRTYGTRLLLFYVPSERLVGRKNNIMPFRSIGTAGELGVLLVVNFVANLNPREERGYAPVGDNINRHASEAKVSPAGEF